VAAGGSDPGPSVAAGGSDPGPSVAAGGDVQPLPAPETGARPLGEGPQPTSLALSQPASALSRHGATYIRNFQPERRFSDE
jgi:hypothetical protein